MKLVNNLYVVNDAEKREVDWRLQQINKQKQRSEVIFTAINEWV